MMLGFWGFILWSVFMLVCGYGIRMRGLSALMDDAQILWSDVRDLIQDDDQQQQDSEQSEIDHDWFSRK